MTPLDPISDHGAGPDGSGPVSAIAWESAPPFTEVPAQTESVIDENSATGSNQAGDLLRPSSMIDGESLDEGLFVQPVQEPPAAPPSIFSSPGSSLYPSVPSPAPAVPVVPPPPHAPESVALPPVTPVTPEPAAPAFDVSELQQQGTQASQELGSVLFGPSGTWPPTHASVSDTQAQEPLSFLPNFQEGPGTSTWHQSTLQDGTALDTSMGPPPVESGPTPRPIPVEAPPSAEDQALLSYVKDLVAQDEAGTLPAEPVQPLPVAAESLDGEDEEGDLTESELELAGQQDPRLPHLTLKRLKREIQEFTAGFESFELETRNRTELLSTALELMLGSTTPESLNGVTKLLVPLLNEELSPDEEEVVQGALEAFCASNDAALVDRSLPALATPLRWVRPSLFAEMLLKARHAQRGMAAHVLWPHFANEYLLGVEEEAKGLVKELLHELTDLPVEDWNTAAERLGPLPSVRRGKIQVECLLPPDQTRFPLVFAVLHQPKAQKLGEQIMEEFRQYPFPDPSAGAFLAFPKYEGAARRFLLRFLKESRHQWNSPVLRSMARDTLVNALTDLPPRRRSESWVPLAIEAITRLPGDSVTRLLDQVRSARTLFKHQWPQACRRAADSGPMSPRTSAPDPALPDEDFDDPWEDS